MIYVVRDGVINLHKMKTPRAVTNFPKRGNHIGDLIVLPSGKVYEWIEFKRWQRNSLKEQEMKEIINE